MNLNSSSKLLLSRAFKLLSVDVLLKFGSLVCLLYYLKFMPQKEFGLFSYALNVCAVATMIFGIGLHSVFNHFYHSDEFEKDRVIHATLVILVFSWILFFLLYSFSSKFVTSFFFTGEHSDFFVLGIALISCLQSFTLMTKNYLMIDEQIKNLQIFKVIEFILINLFAMVFIYQFSGLEFENRMLGLIVGNILVLAIFYKILRIRLKWKLPDKVITKRLLKNGLPMSVGSLANIFISLGDKFSIDKLLDANLLGLYSIGTTVSTIFFAIFLSFQGAWLPFFYKELDFRKALIDLVKMVPWIILFSTAFYGGCHLAIFYGSGYFIGPEYLQLLDFLWCLILAYTFQAIGGMFTGFYQKFEKNYVVTLINLIFSLLNLKLNFTLIVIYGVNGAAYSTLIVSFFLLLTHLFTIFVIFKLKK